MKYFIVEGMLKKDVPFDEKILNEHIAYSNKNAVEPGLMLVSGLKSDNSGGIFIMKAESLEKVEAYLSGDPLKVSGSQEYRITEFDAHYFYPTSSEWFK